MMERIDKLDLIKIKNCSAEDTVKKSLRLGEKTYKRHT